MAFWLASPLMDPSSSSSPPACSACQFAIAKTVAAIGVGLLGGFGVLACSARASHRPAVARRRRQWWLRRLEDPQSEGRRVARWQEPARRDAFGSAAPERAVSRQVAGARLRAGEPDGRLRPGRPGRAHRGRRRRALDPGRDTCRHSSYLNGNAALPLVAGLMEKGMAPAPRWRSWSAAASRRSLRCSRSSASRARQVFAAYLALATIGALLSGLAYQAIAG